jgi:hypothetical protein
MPNCRPGFVDFFGAGHPSFSSVTRRQADTPKQFIIENGLPREESVSAEAALTARAQSQERP